MNVPCRTPGSRASAGFARYLPIAGESGPDREKLARVLHASGTAPACAEAESRRIARMVREGTPRKVASRVAVIFRPRRIPRRGMVAPITARARGCSRVAARPGGRATRRATTARDDGGADDPEPGEARPDLSLTGARR